MSLNQSAACGSAFGLITRRGSWLRLRCPWHSTSSLSLAPPSPERVGRTLRQPMDLLIQLFVLFLYLDWGEIVPFATHKHSIRPYPVKLPKWDIWTKLFFGDAEKHWMWMGWGHWSRPPGTRSGSVAALSCWKVHNTTGYHIVLFDKWICSGDWGNSGVEEVQHKALQVLNYFPIIVIRSL